MIVGSLPLVGVSYQSVAKDKQYLQELASNRATIATIYEKAIVLGITTFAASPFPEQSNKNHIVELKKLGETHSIEVMPCVSIPLGMHDEPVDVYRRWATVYRAYRALETETTSTAAILTTFLTDPILQFRPNWKKNLTNAVKTEKWYSSSEIAAIHLFEPEIEDKLAKLDKLPIREVEYGSELDLLFATGRVDLVGELVDIANTAGYEVALGIHHAGLSFPKIRAAALTVNSILTPINATGVMMFPSQDAAIAEIAKTQKKYRIIGIKCLAGGRIPPIQAFKYLNGKITDFMVGVASISELVVAFEAANKVGLRI